jgi:predicted permease
MEGFWQDLRHAVRGLRRSPGFTVVAVLALALGIGANTSIFTLLNAVLLRPLPGVENPAQLVTFKRLQLNNPDYSFGYPDFLDYQKQQNSFTGLAGHCRTPLSLSHGITERIRGDLVTGDYFSVLGAKAVLGRTIVREDVEAPGSSPAVVLSYGLWQRAFGSDSSEIGRAIRINGHSFTVVGVAGGNFTGTVPGAPVDAWLPITAQPQAIPRMTSDVLQSRAAGWIGIFGRLKPGVAMQAAQAEMKTIAARLAQAYPQTNEHRGVDLFAGVGVDPDDKEILQGFLGVLLAAVGLLLLIACGNVANLLLVRATGRRREIAIRMAMGASRRRLIRQLLTEGVLLSSLAGVAGLLLAPWTASLILAFQQPLYPMTSLDLAPDFRVLCFTLAVAALTGILFGLAPALQSSKPDLVVSLKEGARSAGSRRSRLQSALVTIQVALSLVLLMGAGLALRSMRNVLSSEFGFKAENLVLLSMDLSIQGYSEQQGQTFYQHLMERLEATPGVQSASLAGTVPPQDYSGRISLFYEGQAPAPEILRGHEFELGIRVDDNVISPNYFGTMGIPLVAGRDFTSRDNSAAPRVAIVNEKLAERLWAGESPVGRQIEWPSPEGERHGPIEIIGVAKDTKYRSLLAEPSTLIYLPVLQNYNGRETLLVRTAGDPSGVVPALRNVVAGLNVDLPVYGVKTMSEQVADSLWQQRMAAALIGSFGALALLLTAVGLYGVISHWVAQRTHEIGVRMALGATPKDILGLVLGRGMTVAVLGVVLGVLAARGATRAMSALLYGVGTTDAGTFAAASLLLAAVALAASYFPARRATKVDPMAALRDE